MSTIDLMLLGTLIDHPMNAYEMKRKMEDKSVQEWVKISSPAIYRNLVNLCNQGYLDSKFVKDNEMPEKTIYGVNEKGHQYFLYLMEQCSKNPGNVFINFTAFISNLRLLEYNVAIDLLSNLQNNMYEKIKFMKLIHKQHGGDSNEAEAIIRLYIQMYTLFYDWLCNYEENFSKTK